MANEFHIQHADKIFVNGVWCQAGGGTLALVDPCTETEFIAVAEAVEKDVDAAVEAARNAFDHGDWPRYSPQQRAEVMRKMASILGSRQADLERAFVRQIGGLASFAPFAVGGATATLAGYADLAESYPWVVEQPSSVPGHMATIIRHPVGVVAAIAPWNMPYAIMMQKIAPALAAGCTLLVKPSPETPLEAYIIAEAAEAAGLPPGVLNLLPAHRAASDHLVRHPGVDKISFTGSTAAGKHIGAVAAERVGRVTLELGGKSPAIVLDDMPVEQAADILAQATITLTGQVCALLSRAIVPADKHDAIAEAIAERMRRVTIGDASDPATQMGPIAMKRQLERVQSYVELGVEEGARLVCGGGRPAGLDTGYFIEPTLFANVDNSMRIAQEEIFGPVLCLIPARDEEHAIAIANDSAFGLNSGVLTTRPERVVELGRRIRAGAVGHNGLKADFQLPFGGFKESGVGREGGMEGVAPYTETQVILTEMGGGAIGEASAQ